MPQHVVFLRAINVGGHDIKMAALAHASNAVICARSLPLSLQPRHGSKAPQQAPAAGV